MAAQGNVYIGKSRHRLVIRIPVRKNPYVYIPLMVATAGWVIGLWFLLEFLHHTNHRLLDYALWIIVLSWTLVGLAGSASLFWIFFGYEQIVVDEEMLTTSKPLILYNRYNIYPVEVISRMRLDQELFHVRRAGVWADEKRPVLRFNTPGKEVTVGRGTSNAVLDKILLEMAASGYLKKKQFEAV